MMSASALSAATLELEFLKELEAILSDEASLRRAVVEMKPFTKTELLPDENLIFDSNGYFLPGVGEEYGIDSRIKTKLELCGIKDDGDLIIREDLLLAAAIFAAQSNITTRITQHNQDLIVNGSLEDPKVIELNEFQIKIPSTTNDVMMGIDMSLYQLDGPLSYKVAEDFVTEIRKKKEAIANTILTDLISDIKKIQPTYSKLKRNKISWHRYQHERDISALLTNIKTIETDMNKSSETKLVDIIKLLNVESERLMKNYDKNISHDEFIEILNTNPNDHHYARLLFSQLRKFYNENNDPRLIHYIALKTAYFSEKKSNLDIGKLREIKANVLENKKKPEMNDFVLRALRDDPVHGVNKAKLIIESRKSSIIDQHTTDQLTLIQNEIGKFRPATESNEDQKVRELRQLVFQKLYDYSIDKKRTANYKEMNALYVKIEAVSFDERVDSTEKLKEMSRIIMDAHNNTKRRLLSPFYLRIGLWGKTTVNEKEYAQFLGEEKRKNTHFYPKALNELVAYLKTNNIEEKKSDTPGMNNKGH